MSERTEDDERMKKRIGFVGTNRHGLFLHYCKICGADAGVGFGVDTRHGKYGTWYCVEHNPDEATQVKKAVQV